VRKTASLEAADDELRIKGSTVIKFERSVVKRHEGE